MLPTPPTTAPLTQAGPKGTTGQTPMHCPWPEFRVQTSELRIQGPARRWPHSGNIHKPSKPAHNSTTGKPEQAALGVSPQPFWAPRFREGLGCGSPSRTRGSKKISIAFALEGRELHPGPPAAATATASDLPSLRAGQARGRPRSAPEDPLYQRGWVSSPRKHSQPAVKLG